MSDGANRLFGGGQCSRCVVFVQVALTTHLEGNSPEVGFLEVVCEQARQVPSEADGDDLSVGLYGGIGLRESERGRSTAERRLMLVKKKVSKSNYNYPSSKLTELLSPRTAMSLAYPPFKLYSLCILTTLTGTV